MSDEILQALVAVERAGGSVVFNLATPAGSMQVVARPQQAAAIASGDVHASSLVGLSAAEHKQWLAQGGFVQCNASTSRDARCRNNVSGTAITDPVGWKAMNDSRPYCQVHGGT